MAEMLFAAKRFLEHPEVANQYKRNYSSDLRNHLDGDAPKTAGLRAENIVVGDPGRLRWFGRSGPRLRDLADELRFRSPNIGARRIRNLSESEAEWLRSALEKLRP